MFRKIVVDTKRVALVVEKVLAHRTAGIGREILKRSGVGSRSVHDDRVLHRAVLFEGLHDLGYRGKLLANGDIDADDVRAFLIDDGVHRDGGLTRLTVADDELALSAADWNHGVDRFDARL